MKALTLATLAAVAVCSPSAFAQSFTIEHSIKIACISKDGYDQMMKAVIAKNESWLNQIFEEGECIFVKKGIKGALKKMHGVIGPDEVYLFPSGGGNPKVWWMNLDTRDLDW